MPDISITAANVLAGADAVTENGTAGATETPAQPVYLDTATGKYKLADADGAAVTNRARGLTLNTASDGQPMRIIKSGDLTLNAVLTPGVAYFLSPNPGMICTRADVLTGDKVCQIGIAKSTTVLAVNVVYPDVASA